MYGDCMRTVFRQPLLKLMRQCDYVTLLRQCKTDDWCCCRRFLNAAEHTIIKSLCHTFVWYLWCTDICSLLSDAKTISWCPCASHTSFILINLTNMNSLVLKRRIRRTSTHARFQPWRVEAKCWIHKSEPDQSWLRMPFQVLYQSGISRGRL